MPPASPAAPRADVDVSPDGAAVARRVADWLLDLATRKAGRFDLCLSGGSTPKALYRLMAEAPYRDAFPWAHIHLWWGDERFVPADDPLSNYRMVKEALLDHAPIPAGNVHRAPTQPLSPQEGAAAYARALQAAYGAETLDSGRPLFDVNLLGLGPDGHTASLFPGTQVLEERALWAAAVVGAKAEARITLTYPVLESARHVAFLAEGAGKGPMLKRLLAGDETIPAGRLRPRGALHVFCDAAARDSAEG